MRTMQMTLAGGSRLREVVQVRGIAATREVSSPLLLGGELTQGLATRRRRML